MGKIMNSWKTYGLVTACAVLVVVVCISMIMYLFTLLPSTSLMTDQETENTDSSQIRRTSYRPNHKSRAKGARGARGSTRSRRMFGPSYRLTMEASSSDDTASNHNEIDLHVKDGSFLLV